MDVYLNNVIKIRTLAYTLHHQHKLQILSTIYFESLNLLLIPVLNPAVCLNYAFVRF